MAFDPYHKWLGIPPEDPTDNHQSEAKATGTDNATARQFAPAFAPKTDNWCKSLSIVGKSADLESDNQNEENPKETSVSQGLLKSGRLDLNQRPLRPEPSFNTRLKLKETCITAL